MRKEFLFLVVVFLTQLLVSSARRCGRCADVPVNKDFNLERFQGTWYEIERFPNRFETHLQCVKAEYEYKGNNTIYARNSGRHGSNGYIRKADAKIRMKDSDEPNKLRIEYEIKFFNQTVYKSRSPYSVWKTDYDNYALVYSCRICTIFGHRLKNEKAWILSRNRKLNESYVDDLKDELIGRGVDASKFIETEQSDCDDDNYDDDILSILNDVDGFEFNF